MIRTSSLIGLPEAADRLDFAALQKSQQVGLHLQGHLGNFIEEDRAPVRRFQAAHAVSIGAREAAACVTEELGLEQRIGDRRAIYRDVGPRRTRGVSVDVLRDDVLADSALAGDENFGVAGCCARRECPDVAHRTADVDEAGCRRREVIRGGPQRDGSSDARHVNSTRKTGRRRRKRRRRPKTIPRDPAGVTTRSAQKSEVTRVSQVVHF